MHIQPDTLAAAQISARLDEAGRRRRHHELAQPGRCASSYAARSAAGTRPLAATSMPCAAAQARTAFARAL